MTAVTTMPMIDPFAPRDFIEIDEPESSLDRYRQWCRECDERRRQKGLLEDEDDSITMEEIVAIVKEARAVVYAEEQAKESTHS